MRQPTLAELQGALRDALAEALMPVVRWIDQHRRAAWAIAILWLVVMATIGILDIIMGG
jgi:hypothetical protein